MGNIITPVLPHDLPENWNDTQYVSPGGTEVGLTEKHGYNYLMKQVNNSQKAINELDAEMEDIDTTLANKAPAGYGYGEVLPEVNQTFNTEAEFEAALTPFVNKLKPGEAMQLKFGMYPFSGSGATWCGTLFKHQSAYAALKAFTYTGQEVLKVMSNNVWKPVEWVNPPMDLGVEYRTTERYQGKPVYKKMDSNGVIWWSTDQSTWKRESERVGSYSKTESDALLQKKAPIYQSNVSYPADAQIVWKGNVWKNTSGQSVTGVEPGTNYNIWNVGYSNPNLLDNPWFTVNQRGKSEYTPEDGFNKYTVDRWKSHWGQNVVVNGYGKGITCSLANNFCQFIDHDLSESLRGKDVTLSVKLIDGSVYAVTETIPMVSKVDDLFMTIYLDPEKCPGISRDCMVSLKHGYHEFYTDGFMATLYGGEHGACTWIAIKLELGSVSTLANDGPPDYATELAKCQRYFWRMGGNTGDIFRASSDTVGYAMVHLPVPMRAGPSLSGKIVIWPDNQESTAIAVGGSDLMPYGITGFALFAKNFTGLGGDGKIYTVQNGTDVSITADL